LSAWRHNTEGKEGEIGEEGEGIYRRRRGKLLLPESMGFNSGKTSLRVLLRWKKRSGEEEPDQWVLHGSEGERGSWVPVRVLLSWAAGSFPVWAESSPRGPNRIFIFFSSFLFSVFFFFHNFCKFDSNQAKPFSEIF
jgi:hypothetical protein